MSKKEAPDWVPLKCLHYAYKDFYFVAPQPEHL